MHLTLPARQVILFMPFISFIASLPIFYLGWGAREAAVILTVGASAPLSPPESVALSVAFGVCDGLRTRRLEPGVDFSVVGYDDVIEARTAVPALTTVSVNPQRMGQQAAQLLLRQINSGAAETETLRVATRLVVRDSTARVRTKVEGLAS